MQRRSTLLILGGGRSVIGTGGTNSRLSLSHEKVIASVDPGGWINDQHREDQQSTFTFAVKRLSPLLIWGGIDAPETFRA